MTHSLPNPIHELSELAKLRLDYRPRIPSILRDCGAVELQVESSENESPALELRTHFSKLDYRKRALFIPSESSKPAPQRVGVVFSGGQAPGGHNVVTGLFDSLKEMNQESRLFGFIGGPSGIVEGKSIELGEDDLLNYRNQGGFDLLGSGRTKIETEEQFQKSLEVCQKMQLTGLVVIGGDDSNTNAAMLAQYFSVHQCDCQVIGVPKTIDADLKSEDIELTFGHDTACRIYSELISNIARDALSAKKYYHFIKLMGRSASHITLECALQTRPTLALISEEIAKKEQTLSEVVESIVDVVIKRAEHHKDYGVILVPEGLVEFIPEIQKLIEEINHLLSKPEVQEKWSSLSSEKQLKLISLTLCEKSKEVFESLPKDIQAQLLIDRDPHGNVQVSRIKTEELLAEMVKEKLEKQEDYQGKFSSQTHFLGYEGRAGMPSNFDANYTYALGKTSALLVNFKCNGFISAVKNLHLDPNEWVPCGAPLVGMIHFEMRKGKMKPVIEKALVDLEGAAYHAFIQKRDYWAESDFFLFTGPIQYCLDEGLTQVPLSISV